MGHCDIMNSNTLLDVNSENIETHVNTITQLLKTIKTKQQTLISHQVELGRVAFAKIFWRA